MSENANASGNTEASQCGCSTSKPEPTAAKSSCCGGQGGHAHDHDHHHASDGPSAGPTKVIDPVCGMTVDPATSKHRFDYRGETHHFCSSGCRTKFAAAAKQYLDKSKPRAEVPEGALYTRPMHPQIRQVGPGSSPICGMALEPEVASLDEAPNP